MRPRVLKYERPQTRWLPTAAAEVWEPVEQGWQLTRRLDLALEAIAPRHVVTPIRCLILAHIGRASGLGVTAGLLARQLLTPRATLSYHLDALREHRLIREGRPIVDERRVPMRLTADGARVLQEASDLLIALTCDVAWPAGAPRRDRWNLRRCASAAGDLAS